MARGPGTRGVTTQIQAITTTKKGTEMTTQELGLPAGQQNVLYGPVDSESAYLVSGRLARFTQRLNVLKKVVPVALLTVMVASGFSAAVTAAPAYASGTSLTITAWPQNSTGVPMVVEAITNHVQRGTPDVINMFVNGTRVVECKSRECTIELGVPGSSALVTADVGPRGTVPYTSNAIVSAERSVAVTRQPITCHGTTCI
jgi:hypothetical protein